MLHSTAAVWKPLRSDRGLVQISRMAAEDGQRVSMCTVGRISHGLTKFRAPNMLGEQNCDLQSTQGM